MAASTLKNMHLKNRPKTVLTNDMTNSDKFSWFEAVKKCQKLVFDCISPELVIMLSRDCKADKITEGGRGLLAKLRSHTLPINTRRYEFHLSKQKQGEEFNTWWEKKIAMAESCDWEMMSEADFLATHLV